MNRLANIKMTPKLISSFVALAALAGIVGAVGYWGLATMQGRLNTVTNDATPRFLALMQIKSNINWEMRATRGAIIASTKAKIADVSGDAEAARAAAWQAMQQYQAMPGVSQSAKATADEMQAAMVRWINLSQEVQRLANINTPASKAAATKMSLGIEADQLDIISPDLESLLTLNQNAMAASITQAHTTYTATLINLSLVVGIAILLALLLGWRIARSIVRPLSEVQSAARHVATLCLPQLATSMEALAQGNLTMPAEVTAPPPAYTSRNEIGQTADAVRSIIASVQQTSVAYNTARAELQNLIAQVSHAAEAVTAGSQHMSDAVDQTGQASTQIAHAIEDIAIGVGDQSKNAAAAMDQMTDLNSVVTQVASGAAEQLQAMDAANGAISQMDSTLDQTNATLTLVTHAATRAAATATEGSAAVQQTIRSVDTVRHAVLQSATKVEALGQRSKEVGTIVDAINDIAEQTNLLALNAAIEAARAGEHGKGFAVVAAEVRKLAERAAGETRQITARIGAIQQQTAEVVLAMQAGSSEVEKSAALGQQAQQALESILAVVNDTNVQAQAITDSLQLVTESMVTARNAAQHVSEITTQTSQATEQMRLGADRVSRAIEGIAAVTEESAASAQQVSASTQQQSAHTEEMRASAQELARMATTLQDIVRRFVWDKNVVQGASEQAISTKGNVTTHPSPLRRIA